MEKEMKPLVYLMCKPMFEKPLDEILEICNKIGKKFGMNPAEIMLVFSMDVLKTSVLTGYEMGLGVDMHAYADAVIQELEAHKKEMEEE